MLSGIFSFYQNIIKNNIIENKIFYDFTIFISVCK